MIKIEDYKRWVSDHLQKAADLALRPNVMAPYESSNLLLEKVKLDLSVKEEEFVRQSLATRANPSSQLLIKDLKTINEKGEFQPGWSSLRRTLPQLSPRSVTLE